MSKPEFPLSKVETVKQPSEVGLIEVLAEAETPDADFVDNRAVDTETFVAAVGETWLRQEIRHTNQLHWIRIFVLVALLGVALVWLLSVGTLLLLSGFRWKEFVLSDLVLVTYMGTTTTSALGLFHIAAKWLFSAGFVDFARSVRDLMHPK